MSRYFRRPQSLLLPYSLLPWQPVASEESAGSENMNLSLNTYLNNLYLSHPVHVCVFSLCQVTMADRSAADRACKDPNPIIDGRKANVNLAYLGAKPRVMQPGKDSPKRSAKEIGSWIFSQNSTWHGQICFFMLTSKSVATSAQQAPCVWDQ